MEMPEEKYSQFTEAIDRMRKNLGNIVFIDKEEFKQLFKSDIELLELLLDLL